MTEQNWFRKFARQIESINRKITYGILRLFLRNRPHTIPLDSTKIQRILLFRYDAIGDMVVTTAAMDLLHKNLPGIEIDVICSEYNYHIVRHNPQFKNVFIHKKRLCDILSLVRQVRKYKYDAVFCFVLFKTTYAGLLANMLAGRQSSKITILFEARKKLYDVFFNVHIPLERDKYTMAELQARMVCDVFGWNYTADTLTISIPLGESNIDNANTFLEAHQIPLHSPFIVYNISAGREYREFSIEKSREILMQCAEIFSSVPVVIIAIEKDVPKAEKILQVLPQGKYFIFNSNDILDICAVVSRSAMVISPDTSLVHIASAYKKPTVAFYSEMTTYIYEWMPFNVPYRFLVAPNKLEIEHIPTAECVYEIQAMWGEIHS